MDHDSSLMFARRVDLNNRGVAKLVKEQDLAEAYKLFRRALYCVKKQGTNWLHSKHMYGPVNPQHRRKVAKRLTTGPRPVPRPRPTTQHDGVSQHVAARPSHQELAQGINGANSPLRNTRGSVSCIRPIRLGINGLPSDAAATSLRWSLATTIVAFNLGMTSQNLGFIAAPSEASVRWNAAFTLYELACSLRLIVVTKQSFKGDMLASLDSLIVQSTMDLHTRLGVSASKHSSVRQLESYVQLVKSSLNKH